MLFACKVEKSRQQKVAKLPLLSLKYT